MVFTNEGRNKVRDELSGLGLFTATGSVGSPAFTAGDVDLGSEIARTNQSAGTVRVQDRLVEFESVLPTTEPAGIQPIFTREMGLFDGSPTNTSLSLALAKIPEVEKTPDVEQQNVFGIRVD